MCFFQFCIVNWTFLLFFWKINVRVDGIGQNWGLEVVPMTNPNIKIGVWFILEMWRVKTFPRPLCTTIAFRKTLKVLFLSSLSDKNLRKFWQMITKFFRNVVTQFFSENYLHSQWIFVLSLIWGEDPKSILNGIQCFQKSIVRIFDRSLFKPFFLESDYRNRALFFCWL